MAKVLNDIKAKITPNMVIPKPHASGDFLVKGWGIRRGKPALIYTIPNRKTPTKPYEKGVTESEWEQAFQQLLGAGDFSRSWFEQSMSECAKEGDCNFTTIGGIFEALGYATYERGVYRSKHICST
jgi:hypothetical protein